MDSSIAKRITLEVNALHIMLLPHPHPYFHSHSQCHPHSVFTHIHTHRHLLTSKMARSGSATSWPVPHTSASVSMELSCRSLSKRVALGVVMAGRC